MDNHKTLQDRINIAQNNLSCFTINNKHSNEYLMGKKVGNSKFLIFELLDRKSDGSEKVFDLYTSNNLADIIAEKIESNKDNIINILEKNFEIFSSRHKEWKWNSQIENLIISLRESNEKSTQKRKDLINACIDKYRNMHVPTNIGATALIYEAWYNGTLDKQYYCEEKNYTRLINALFLEKNQNQNTKAILEKMANNLGINNIKNLDEYDLTSCNQRWKQDLDIDFAWIEYSLIHQLIPEKTNFLLVHYPLIIDDYFFVGVAYTSKIITYLSRIEAFTKISDTPEIYDPKKYAKMCVLINAEMYLIKEIRKKEIVEEIWKEYSDNNDEKLLERLLIKATRKLFTCFDVFCQDKDDSDLDSEFLILSSNGVKIYGPSWIKAKNSDYTKKLSEEIREIEKYFREQIEKRENLKSINIIVGEERAWIEQYHIIAHEIRKLVRNIEYQNQEQAYILDEIRHYFNVLFTLKQDRSTPEYLNTILPRNFCNSGNFQSFIENSMKYAARIHIITSSSENSLFPSNKQDFEVKVKQLSSRLKFELLDQITIYRIGKPGTNITNVMYCSMFTSAFRNVLEHSRRGTPICVSFNKSQELLTLRNERKTLTEDPENLDGIYEEESNIGTKAILKEYAKVILKEYAKNVNVKANYKSVDMKVDPSMIEYYLTELPIYGNFLE
jgi:hypothetical protein